MSSQISSLSSYGIALFTKIPIIKDSECNFADGVHSGCILPVEKNQDIHSPKTRSDGRLNSSLGENISSGVLSPATLAPIIPHHEHRESSSEIEILPAEGSDIQTSSEYLRTPNGNVVLPRAPYGQEREAGKPYLTSARAPQAGGVRTYEEFFLLGKRRYSYAYSAFLYIKFLDITEANYELNLMSDEEFETDIET